MPRNGWTRERVIDEAVRLVERGGAAEFSMRSLAEALDISPSSLYNHVESMDALLLDVCVRALELQRDVEVQAMEGLEGREAVFALAHASRAFAREHWELYRLIVNMAAACGERLGASSRCIVEPFFRVLEPTRLTQEEKIHWQRTLRAMIHGFVSQEKAGFFAHLPADAEVSFQTAVQCYVDGLAQAEARAQA